MLSSFCKLAALLIAWMLMAPLAQGQLLPKDRSITSVYKKFWSSAKPLRVEALPVLAYAPETNLAYGASVQLVAKYRSLRGNRVLSLIRPTFYATQNDQWEFRLPYNLAITSRWSLEGEFSYRDFNFQFYGIGNGAENNAAEAYSYQRLRSRTGLLRLMRNSTYMGPVFHYDRVTLDDRVSRGQLATGEIVGSDGGKVTGLGWLTRVSSGYGTYPVAGDEVISELMYYAPLWGGDFRFWRYTLRINRCIPIGIYRLFDIPYDSKWGRKHILALQVRNESIWGDAPFDQLAMLGGPDRLRGIFEGQFRDQHAFNIQAEYRADIWWRFRFHLHWAWGMVAPRIRSYSLANSRHTYGIGGRFAIDRYKRLNLRADYAWSKYGNYFYFGLGEAF